MRTSITNMDKNRWWMIKRDDRSGTYLSLSKYKTSLRVIKCDWQQWRTTWWKKAKGKWVSINTRKIRKFPFFYFVLRIITSCYYAVTFSNTFDNLYKSRRAYAQWHILYKLWFIYISLEVFFLICVVFRRQSLVCSSNLSAYLWLSFLISSLTYGTLTMILRHLFWNLWIISMFQLAAVPQSWTRPYCPYCFKDCFV